MNMFKLLISISLLFLLLCINTAFAKSVAFDREYTYQASEADSKLSCRAIALEQVKRLLLEELGTYLESETVIKNLKLTKDQITTLTAGIVRTEIVDEKWDGHIYTIKAKIISDPDEVIKSVDSLRKDKLTTKELEDTRKEASEYLKELELLRKEVESLKGKGDTQKLEQYTDNINKLSATDWKEKGYAFFNEKKYDKALEAYNKAIELNPKYAVAYSNRGIVYDELGKYQEAITDLDKAIELNPNLAQAFNNRGVAYNGLGKYQQAIADLDKAIELNPGVIEVYINRGAAYIKLGKYQQPSVSI